MSKAPVPPSPGYEENNNLGFGGDRSTSSPPRPRRSRSRENHLNHNNSTSVYSINSSVSGYPDSTVGSYHHGGAGSGYDTYIKPKIKKGSYEKRNESYMQSLPRTPRADRSISVMSNPTYQEGFYSLPRTPKHGRSISVFDNTYPGETSTSFIVLQDDEAKQSPRSSCCQGFSPKVFSSLAYFLAAALFALVFNIDRQQLNEIPFPVVGNILPLRYQNGYEETAIIPLIMWGFHFLRRFAEVLFVQEYHRTFSCVEAFGCLVYYSIFALWTGLSMNYNNGYLIPHPLVFYLGLIVFVVGEAGNCICHVNLRQLRKRSSAKTDMQRLPSRHVLPTGFCFQFVSCPHYLFEMITWVGFAVACMTLATFAFWLVSTMVLMKRAYSNHGFYKKEFKARPYPKNRKAVIPFIF